MKILSTEKSRGLRRYRVIKSFLQKVGEDKHPRALKVGEEIALRLEEEKAWGHGEVQRGRLEPVLPPLIICRALKDISAVVGDKKVEVAKDALVELPAADYLRRVGSREVVPVDRSTWCPYSVRRRTPAPVLNAVLQQYGSPEEFLKKHPTAKL